MAGLNAHNIVAAGHAKLRKQAQVQEELAQTKQAPAAPAPIPEKKLTLAQRKAMGPSERTKMKREIKKEIKRLEDLYESL